MTTLTEPKTHTLDVPGAVLTYDIRKVDASTEPVLLMFGCPMGAGGFATLAGLFADLFHSAVKDLFGNALFTFPHHAVDELCHQHAVVDRIRKDLTSFCCSSSCHNFCSEFQL